MHNSGFKTLCMKFKNTQLFVYTISISSVRGVVFHCTSLCRFNPIRYVSSVNWKRGALLDWLSSSVKSQQIVWSSDPIGSDRPLMLVGWWRCSNCIFHYCWCSHRFVRPSVRLSIFIVQLKVNLHSSSVCPIRTSVRRHRLRRRRQSYARLRISFLLLLLLFW